MREAIELSITHLQENYKNVKVGDPVQVKQAGPDGFVMDGIGEESDGTAVVYRMAWVTSNDGQIGKSGSSPTRTTRTASTPGAQRRVPSAHLDDGGAVLAGKTSRARAREGRRPQSGAGFVRPGPRGRLFSVVLAPDGVTQRGRSARH